VRFEYKYFLDILFFIDTKVDFSTAIVSHWQLLQLYGRKSVKFITIIIELIRNNKCNKYLASYDRVQKVKSYEIINVLQVP